MAESSAIDELRLALHHLGNAAGRVLDGFREATTVMLERTGLAEPLARVRPTRVLENARHRLRAWRSPRETRGEVRIALSQRLTGRFPVSHDEFEGLCRRLERLEQQLAQRVA